MLSAHSEVRVEPGEYALEHFNSPHQDLVNQDVYYDENYKHSLTT